MSPGKPQSVAQKRQRMRLRVLDANRVLATHAGTGNERERMARKILREASTWLEKNP